MQNAGIASATDIEDYTTETNTYAHVIQLGKSKR